MAVISAAVALDARAMSKALEMAREHDCAWLQASEPDSSGGFLLDLYRQHDPATFVGRWRLSVGLFDCQADLVGLAGSETVSLGLVEAHAL